MIFTPRIFTPKYFIDEMQFIIILDIDIFIAYFY